MSLQSQPERNQLHLLAQVVALQALRYTPAGLPVLELELTHQSVQCEAGQNRQTNLSIRAIAFGLLAEEIAKLPLGQDVRFAGVLAAGKNGKGLIFHLQSLDISFLKKA